MSGAEIRELVNGSIFPLMISLSIIILCFLYFVRKYNGPEWRQTAGVGTACVLFWIFASEAARSGAAWLVLRTQNAGYPTQEVLFYTTGTYIIAGIILAYAALRCIYFFTPPAWGNKAWIASGILVVVFLCVSEILQLFGI